MSFISAADGFSGPGRRRHKANAFDAFCCAVLLISAGAATYYVLVLLLIAFVEQVTSMEAFARAAWLSIHPAALARILLAQI